MNIFPKKNFICFTVLTAIITLCNYYLYRLEAFGPLPEHISIASIIDFLVVIPLLAYFLIIRNRYSIKYLTLVVLAGYFTAKVIVPLQQIQLFSHVSVLLITFILFIELYLFCIMAYKAKKTIIYYRKIDGSLPFPEKLRCAFSDQNRLNRGLEIVLSELTMLYFAFFSWKNKTTHIEDKQYTYHKKTAAIAFRIMLIHALFVESIGFHYLLMQWSEVVACFALLLNLYMLIFLLADIQAIRTCPYLLSKKELKLRNGLTMEVNIALDNIQSIARYSGPEQLSVEEKERTFDGVVQEFIKEKPTFQIKLYSPVTMRMMFGFEKKIDNVHLSVDEGNLFYEALQKEINKT